jgi:hypothetical protein
VARQFRDPALWCNTFGVHATSETAKMFWLCYPLNEGTLYLLFEFTRIFLVTFLAEVWLVSWLTRVKHVSQRFWTSHWKITYIQLHPKVGVLFCYNMSNAIHHGKIPNIALLECKFLHYF